MELCQGNIRSIIKNNFLRFSEGYATDILRDICKALSFIHKLNIVHLNVKPENILYSRTEKYKLADLGLARLTYKAKGENFQNGDFSTSNGDCRYMAPELLYDYDHGDK